MANAGQAERKPEKVDGKSRQVKLK